MRMPPVLAVVSGELIVIGGGFVAYKAATIWHTTNWPWLVKLGAFIALLLAAVLMLDNGVGLMFRQNTSPQPVEKAGETHNLFLLFHGYNGNGESLLEIMGSHLAPYGDVVAFKPSFDGYNHDALLEQVEKIIYSHRSSKIFVYGESYGGMVVADLLRCNPDLQFHSLTLNAAPDSPARIKLGGKLLRIFNYVPGGPLSTSLLRWKQQGDVANSPAPETGVNLEVMRQAQRRSLKITAPMAFDQLGFMGNFDPVQPEEFEGRVEVVRFIHAPGPSDAFIKNAEASAGWQAAFPDADFKDVATTWPAGMHTPTPERPSQVVAVILQTVT